MDVEDAGDLAAVEDVEGVVDAVDVGGAVGAVLLVQHDVEDCVG